MVVMVEQTQESKSAGRWQVEELHQQIPQQAFSHMQT